MAPHSHQDAHAHVETGAFPAEGQVAMQLTLPLGNVLTLIWQGKAHCAHPTYVLHLHKCKQCRQAGPHTVSLPSCAGFPHVLLGKFRHV